MRELLDINMIVFDDLFIKLENTSGMETLIIIIYEYHLNESD
jgi:hypothetical protein